MPLLFFWPSMIWLHVWWQWQWQWQWQHHSFMSVRVVEEGRGEEEGERHELQAGRDEEVEREEMPGNIAVTSAASSSPHLLVEEPLRRHFQHLPQHGRREDNVLSKKETRGER